ncbi:hypothetical protein ACNKHP_20430 [Shigella boydii]
MRYFLLSAHYPSELNYSEETLKQARAALERLTLRCAAQIKPLRLSVVKSL